MNWFLFAVIGHLANAGAFVIDKILLTTALKRGATYAAMIGSFSLLALFASPWVTSWPDASALPEIFAFGALFVFALWSFFEALRRAEATRVVPVVGSLIPVFTLLGTSVAFDERLSANALVGFVLLILSTFLLTRGGSSKTLDRHALILSLIAALLFAASSVFGKAAYADATFLGAFVASRAVAGSVGLLLIAFLPDVRAEIAALFSSRRKPTQKFAAPLAVFGQLMGAFGFVFVHLALAAGSASVVNALQAVQYAFLVLVAWLGGKRVAAALREEKTARVIAIKSAAIILVGIGLLLIGASA